MANSFLRLRSLRSILFRDQICQELFDVTQLVPYILKLRLLFLLVLDHHIIDDIRDGLVIMSRRIGIVRVNDDGWELGRFFTGGRKVVGSDLI